MGVEENKALVRQYMERTVVDPSAQDEFLSPDRVNHAAIIRDVDRHLSDLERSKRVVAGFARSFSVSPSDFQVVLAEGDLVGVLVTGNEVAIPSPHFFRVAGGKIVEHWGGHGYARLDATARRRAHARPGRLSYLPPALRLPPRPSYAPPPGREWQGRRRKSGLSSRPSRHPAGPFEPAFTNLNKSRAIYCSFIPVYVPCNAQRLSSWEGGRKMDQAFVLLFWTGPIGIGFFLMGLGVLFWGISRFDRARRGPAEKSETPK